MSLNVAQGFETVQNKSAALAVGSFVSSVLSEALGAPAWLLEMFGWGMQIGIWGAVVGWTGKKVSE